MRNKRQSLAEKLSLTTGLQLILVAGSLSILSFTLGRQGAIQQRKHSGHASPWFKSQSN